MNYTFTLTRAHKIVERVQKLISDLEIKIITGLTPVYFSYPNHIASQNDFNSKYSTAYNDLDLLMEFVTLRTNIKNLIGEANQVKGINFMLAQINANKTKLQLLRKIEELSNIDNNTITASNLPKWVETISTTQAVTDNSCSIKVIPRLMDEAYKEEIKRLEKSTFMMNDTLSDLNKSTIVVEICDTKAELLGLK